MSHRPFDRFDEPFVQRDRLGEPARRLVGESEVVAGGQGVGVVAAEVGCALDAVGLGWAVLDPEPEALLEAEGITVTRHRAREVERVAARVSEARSALLRDADDAAGRLEGRGRAARFLLEHGSVAGMLEARFPTLVDVSASLRDVPGTGVVVTEAYRASVAAICRSLLVAELCMDRRVVPERLDDAYTRALGALEARSVGLQLSDDARMAVGDQR